MANKTNIVANGKLENFSERKVITLEELADKIDLLHELTHEILDRLDEQKGVTSVKP